MYYVSALAFIAVGYYFGWIEKDALVVPSFLTALVCVALGNLDKFKSFKAAGVEATLKDAQVALQESRELVLTVSKMLLSLVKRTGRLGGFPPAKEREFRDSIDRILARVNASDSERKQVFEDWELFIKIDYVFGILGHTIPDFSGDANAGTGEWKALRERTGERLDPPSADELDDFLRRYKFLSGEISELAQDYRHYLQNAKHRRPEVWERRHDWGARRLKTGM